MTGGQQQESTSDPQFLNTKVLEICMLKAQGY